LRHGDISVTLTKFVCYQKLISWVSDVIYGFKYHNSRFSKKFNSNLVSCNTVWMLSNSAWCFFTWIYVCDNVTDKNMMQFAFYFTIIPSFMSVLLQ